MVMVTLLLCSAPITAGRADHDCDEAEHEIDRHQLADLAEIARRDSEIARGDGAPEPLPRREIEMQVEQHHDDADPLHDIDMQGEALEAAEPEEDHGVAAR